MHQNSQIAPRSCCSQAHAASQPSATPVRVSRRCKSSKIGDSAVPVVEERVLQGPLPTARIENPMRNLAQSTEIIDIEPFSYPTCVEEKRFPKVDRCQRLWSRKPTHSADAANRSEQDNIRRAWCHQMRVDDRCRRLTLTHTSSPQIEPAAIPSRCRPALASSHRRRRKNLAHPKCVQQPFNRSGAPSTVLIGRSRGLLH